eukprot:TRINITY_DN1196_c0_g1_i1.p1 TRINITY_DN1196_c0_g1~~TRINITY_DN1196_c0_g1_i1.p1  ORF type:complete len:763 (-),score=183.01 TRINITY_DN1196_c0_g1_i1:5-2293(-)
MDFFKKLVEIEREDELPSLAELSRSDLEALATQKMSQLKESRTKFDDLRRESEGLKVEYDALRRKHERAQRLNRTRAEQDKSLITQLRGKDPSAAEEYHIQGLQATIKELQTQFGQLEVENEKFQKQIELLQRENKDLEERKRTEYGLYERKVSVWQEKAKATHEQDLKTIAELRQKLADMNERAEHDSRERVAETSKQLMEQLDEKDRQIQRLQLAKEQLTGRLEKAEKSTKDVEERLVALQRAATQVVAGSEPREGKASDAEAPSSPVSEEMWQELEADRQRLYQRLKQAEEEAESARVAASTAAEKHAAEIEEIRNEIRKFRDERDDEIRVQVHHSRTRFEAERATLQAKLKEAESLHAAAESRLETLRTEHHQEQEESSWEILQLQKQLAEAKDALAGRTRELESARLNFERSETTLVRLHAEQLRISQQTAESRAAEDAATISSLRNQLTQLQEEAELHAGVSAAPVEPVYLSVNQDLASRVSQLQEEVRIREESISRLCNETDELRHFLREAEDRIAALQHDFQQKELLAEEWAKERGILRQRISEMGLDVIRMEGCVEDLTKERDSLQKQLVEAQSNFEKQHAVSTSVTISDDIQQLAERADKAEMWEREASALRAAKQALEVQLREATRMQQLAVARAAQSSPHSGAKSRSAPDVPTGANPFTALGTRNHLAWARPSNWAWKNAKAMFVALFFFCLLLLSFFLMAPKESVDELGQLRSQLLQTSNDLQLCLLRSASPVHVSNVTNSTPSAVVGR